MNKHTEHDTREHLLATGEQLCLQRGFTGMGLSELLKTAEVPKGSFYHYFAGKDALLSSLSTLFDEKYQELIPNMDPGLSAFDQLIYLNHELFFMIENSVSLDLLARLLSTQLVTTSEKHLMDQNRYYFKILRKICTDGQRSGELRQDISINEMVRTYALQERALLYDWCICGGNYSLSVYATNLLPNLLCFFKNNKLL